MEIAVGMKGTASALVGRNQTAKEMGSGSLLVYATPCMAALMEESACNAIASVMENGKTSVGMELNLKHTAATPVGMDVHADAEVTAVNKNIITYKITAYDEAGEIGSAEHKRAIVTTEHFLDKTYSKL